MSDDAYSSVEVAKWKSDAYRRHSVSEYFRSIATEKNWNKFQLASALTDIFPDLVSGEDIQAVWKWDMNGKGEGLSDLDLDDLLKHLIS